jgi:hypothetical protein
MILGKFRRLSPDERKEVLDFLDSLAYRGIAQKWIEFDEWALALGKAKGFSNLTEVEVTRIVSDFRSRKEDVF